MADLKRRTLQLSSGKQIKLFGNSVAISKSLEIGEGYAPNILSAIEEQPDNKIPAGISNPHRLTVEELMELADFNIQLASKPGYYDLAFSKGAKKSNTC